MIRYEGDRTIAGNPVMANYEMEDSAARLLYESGQRLKKPSAVDAEKLARYMGASLRDEYLTDSAYSLCAVALENQTLRVGGKALVMSEGDIVIERALKDRGEKEWYAYAIFHGLAHLYLHSQNGDDGQMSFDLTAISSDKHFICDYGELTDIFADADLDSRPMGETQADVFAGCLMMPKVPFKTAANNYLGKRKINRADLKGETRDDMIRHLAKIFAAPEIAVALRLKKLLYL